MAYIDLIQSLQRSADTKIVLLVIDGLGGLPVALDGPTELEAAKTPNLDRLAAEGTLGQIVPVRYGITPGSGPAHLALFGYDPLIFDVGRGVLEASGVGMHVAVGDIAARGNFCTVDKQGNITDRRAGRIPTEEAAPLVELLGEITLPDVTIEVRAVREYRFVVVMRGENLHADLEDTDPQKTGVPPLPVQAENSKAQRTADLFQSWVELAAQKLGDRSRANAVTLRGHSTNPCLPQFPDVYGLRSACIAVYPMYKGVSSLLGMQILDFAGETPEEEFAAVKAAKQDFDFFFVHIKKTDSMGEDGNFEGKVAVIEALDAALPSLLETEPDVIGVTGDHSTPAKMSVHSWHPVPLLLWAPSTVRQDGNKVFGERACALGGLGTFPSADLMSLLMAHAGRLEKYGA
jgi:2,3-bisphosphoglycerate-independent phosphoglycerate mutase